MNGDLTSMNYSWNFHARGCRLILSNLELIDQVTGNGKQLSQLVSECIWGQPRSDDDKTEVGPQPSTPFG